MERCPRSVHWGPPRGWSRAVCHPPEDECSRGESRRGFHPHWGPEKTNNGCSWDGYHKYSSTSATADTEKKGGNRVEVHVCLVISGQMLQDWDSTNAIASASGSISFNYSDHNANPQGSPPNVGYRIY